MIDWNNEEIFILKEWVKNNGSYNWTNCSRIIKGKTPKSCRIKWNEINSNLNKDNFEWTKVDEAYLLLAVNNYGTCWSKIGKLFHKNLESSAKNKFYSILRRTASNRLNVNNNSKVNIFNLNYAELLVFLPSSILEYKQIVGEEMFYQLKEKFQKVNNFKCESDKFDFTLNEKVKINICKLCKDKLKSIIKKNFMANMIKKSLNNEKKNDDFNNELDEIMNTSNKIDKIRQILRSFNENLKCIN